MAPSASTPTKIEAVGLDAEYAPCGDPALAFPDDSPTGPPLFKSKHEEREYLKQRLALSFRVFAHFGFSEGVAGHITLRDPVDPNSFWVNPFGQSIRAKL